MDSFRALAVGTKFDFQKHGDQMRMFSKSKAPPKKLHTGALAADAAAGPSSSHGASGFPLAPPPAATLSLFGSAGAGSGSDGAGAPEQPHSATALVAASPHKPLPTMTRKKMVNMWRKNELQVEGKDIPAPIQHYSDLVRPPLNTPKHVVTNLFERAHRIPTPIQMQAIPTLIHRRDVLACAPTGSGKTLAFLIPLFALLQTPNPEAGIRALIISPTTELAVQIERETFFLTKGQRWKLVQHGQSTKGKDIFITTPGRVVSMLESKHVNLGNVQYIIFDEGDRLWDRTTDFLDVVKKILDACTNTNRVVGLFSATLSERVEQAARSIMKDEPIRMIVRGRTAANVHVKQQLLFCTNELGKIVAMRNFIREGLTPPVLIFVQSIERTKELFEEIRCNGLHVGLIHGKMTTEEREAVVLDFRLGKLWVLITTELLSRGIDFKKIGTVINFDVPLTVESYIHRIGRTGRAGKVGTAITFFTEDDTERLPAIARVVKESGNEVDQWILDLKVNRKRARQLERNTPQRMIVSTKKRILVGKQRIERQIKQAERERAKGKAIHDDAEYSIAGDSDDE